MQVFFLFHVAIIRTAVRETLVRQIWTIFKQLRQPKAQRPVEELILGASNSLSYSLLLLGGI